MEVNAHKAGVGGSQCIPGMQNQDWRRHLAARPRELLRHDLYETGQADGVLVEERHDAQT